MWHTSDMTSCWRLGATQPGPVVCVRVLCSPGAQVCSGVLYHNSSRLGLDMHVGYVSAQAPVLSYGALPRRGWSVAHYHRTWS